MTTQIGNKAEEEPAGKPDALTGEICTKAANAGTGKCTTSVGHLKQLPLIYTDFYHNLQFALRCRS